MNGASSVKILILSFYYEPDLSAGSFRTSALVKSMLDQLPSDAHIDVITSNPNRYESFIRDALRYEVHPKLTINRIDIPSHKSGMLDQSNAFMCYAIGVLRLLECRKYDLVFATSSRLMTAALGAFVAKRMNSKLYLDIRDIFVDTLNDILPKTLAYGANAVFSILESWAVRRAFKVSLVSQGFLPYFRDKYPSLNIALFTNGIDEDFAVCQPAYSTQKYSRELSVVYAGNIGEGQGLHLIIPELAQRFVGRLQFKLIGDGGRKKQLVSALSNLGSSNVEILPPVARAELIRIYQGADVLFLHLNDYEAFRKVLPSKVFEYGALGKPIWAGVAGYAKEFLKENLNNSSTFIPCNVDDAESSFEYLEIKTRPRKDFVDKFLRVDIMKKMAADVISVAANDPIHVKNNIII